MRVGYCKVYRSCFKTFGAKVLEIFVLMIRHGNEGHGNDLVIFRQPSAVFQPTGAAGEADHVEPGSVPSKLRAQDRSKWRSVVETAMLTAGRAT